jgi:deoxyribodipyrimidine photolyase-related protein
VTNAEKINMNNSFSTIKFILGDQLNLEHPWFETVDQNVLFVMMEVRSETDYVQHHVQKVVAIFDAMRKFSELLIAKGHHVHYLKINDSENRPTITENLELVCSKYSVKQLHYQLPDEYRIDQELKQLQSRIGIPTISCDTFHFLTTREEFGDFFKGKKTFLMENFYRYMRLKHQILMDGSNKPIGGKWNFDHENRKKVPKNHTIQAVPLEYKNVLGLINDIEKAGIKTIGTVSPTEFSWTTTRSEAIKLLDDFISIALPFFGTLQDAMTQKHWYLYHSRLSFAMNVKLISPLEVIRKVEAAYLENPGLYELNQIEGFIRQILGWREYMRGVYWSQMPEYSKLNFFENKRSLPTWFWTGNTKMNCLKQAISQSLKHAYAHHIQRLMITGNFALLAGIHPDEVDQWYLGIYIDAFEWVEITNTRGMSQFADGGIVGSKPYVSSAAYIHKMSDYCEGCHYQFDKKVGEKACPFNSLYWNFFDEHEEKLKSNPRLGMMLNLWKKMPKEDQIALIAQAKTYLNQIETL